MNHFPHVPHLFNYHHTWSNSHHTLSTLTTMFNYNWTWTGSHLDEAFSTLVTPVGVGVHLVMLPEQTHVSELGLTHVTQRHAVALNGADTQTDGRMPGQLFTSHKHLTNQSINQSINQSTSVCLAQIHVHKVLRATHTVILTKITLIHALKII